MIATYTETTRPIVTRARSGVRMLILTTCGLDGYVYDALRAGRDNRQDPCGSDTRQARNTRPDTGGHAGLRRRTWHLCSPARVAPQNTRMTASPVRSGLKCGPIAGSLALLQSHSEDRSDPTLDLEP